LQPGALAQEPVHKLNLVIVEGEGAINNVHQRVAREPIVQVEDENHKPVAGAAVIFLLPSRGAGGTFADGSHSLTVITDQQGRAVAHGLTPNATKGSYQIHVTASINGATANAAINQSNAVAAGAGTAAAAGGISGKIIAILAVAAAAAAGGAYAATHTGGSSNTTPAPGTTITPGAGTVGPPR
jgi:hypothetical protein